MDKFTRTNPNYDYKEKLDKEGDLKQKVIASLQQAKNGNSWKSTNNSDSIGGKEPQKRLGTAVSSSNLGGLGGIGSA